MKLQSTYISCALHKNLKLVFGLALLSPSHCTPCRNGQNSISSPIMSWKCVVVESNTYKIWILQHGGYKTPKYIAKKGEQVWAVNNMKSQHILKNQLKLGFLFGLSWGKCGH